MKDGLAIVAALPREVAALVKGWQSRRPAKNIVVYTKGRVVVVCAGMGAARAVLAAQAARETMPVKTLMSVGLAGACDTARRVGDIVRAAVVADSMTGERFESLQGKDVVVTTRGLASVAEKLRLRAAYGAAAVDMEAAAVARIARAHGLEFRAIKAISDEADFELGGLSRFATADGQFREMAFALHAAVRPRMWSKVIGLGRNSAKAVAALRSAIEVELDLYR